MEIDTRITDIYIHAYIHIREPSSSTDLNFTIQFEGRESLRRGFPKYSLSLSLSSRIFFLLFGGRRREGKKLRSSKNPPFEVSANTMYLIPFIPRANTRAGKGLEGLGRGRISPIMDGRRVFRQREDLFLVDLQCFMVSVSLLQQIIAN